MKKKLLYFTGAFLGISLMFPTLVNATSAKISVSANKSSVIVGNTVSVTYRISSSNAIGAWDYQITTPSNFSLQSCNNGQAAHQNGYASNNSTKSISVTCTFKATATDKGTFSVKNYEVDDFKTEENMGTTVGSSTVSVINATTSNTTTNAKEAKTYSNNNNLKSLSIDGYKLDPEFKKDITKYSLEIENDVKSVKVKAIKESNTASISGNGEIKVEEGPNKIEIKVTAENGSVKTYTINVTVKEKSPIKVTIDNEEYTVIRKKDNIKAPNSTYKDTTISIEGEEIPAFNSDITKYTLVGLKNKEGDINLYIYYEKDKSFQLYKELTFKSVILYIINDSTMIPKGYEKSTITINKEEVTAYKSTKNKDFYLIYGMNIETGKTNLYSYDESEETLQRYIEQKQNTFEDYYIYGIVGLATILILTYITILVNLIRKKTKYKDNFIDE